MSSQVAYALRPSRGERSIRDGVTLYLCLLIGLPIVTLVVYGLSDGSALREVFAPGVARSALWLTLWTSALVAIVNLIFGTATAYALVRFDFPGKALISALIDLPLAIPTLVSGVMLAILFGPASVLGQKLSGLGVTVLYAQPGIVLALAFVTLPLVVRAVEPILEELDPSEEEAARTLGAGSIRTFRTVVLPAIKPAALSSALRSFSRALGEFGSVVIVSGNIPLRTLTAPAYIAGEIESGAPRTAAALSVVLLAAALSLFGLAQLLERRFGGKRV
jgi:sulfate transport system permease protein